MYKLLLAGSLLIAFTACNTGSRKSTFELKGTLTNTNGETVYLEKLAGQKPVIVDSAQVDENGNFEFKNYDPKIGFYRLVANEQSFAMLVLDSADKVNLTGNYKDLGNTYKVTGSIETELFMQYNEVSKKDRVRMDSLSQLFQSLASQLGLDQLQQTNPDLAAKRGDSLSKTLEGPYMAILQKANANMAEKVKKNLNMFSTIMAIQGLDPDKYFNLFVELDKNLMKKYPSNQNVLMFHEVVSKSLALSEGREAPEINLPDTQGNPLSLKSFRGKIVLIDFWASWCGPCRKEMPNVVKAYTKFKGKGFEIFGVSLDQSKDKWLDAIQKDGITWPQVSDLKYWECEAARDYNVQGIPFTVLLDKDGKILAKNLRGEELEKAIEKALAGEPLK
jgi:peroxiredoxin